MFKKFEKEKIAMDDTENNERDASSTVILRASSFFNLQHAKLTPADSPLTRVSLRSEFSSSSPGSNGFCSSSEDGSPFSSQWDETTKSPTPNIGYRNGLWLGSSSPEFHLKSNDAEKLIDDLGLSESLCQMNISEREKGIAQTKQYASDPDGYGLVSLDAYSGLNGTVRSHTETYMPRDGSCEAGFANEGLFPSSNHVFLGVKDNADYNTEIHVPYEGLNSGCFGYDGLGDLPHGVSSVTGDYIPALPCFHVENNSRGFDVSDHGFSDNLSPHSRWYSNPKGYHFDRRQEDGKSWSGTGGSSPNLLTDLAPYLDGAIPDQSLSIHPLDGGFAYYPPSAVDFDSNGNRRTIDPGIASDMSNTLQNYTLLGQNTFPVPNSFIPGSHVSVKGGGESLHAFNLEDSLITQGSLTCDFPKQPNPGKGYNKSSRCGINIWERTSKPVGIRENGQGFVGYGNPLMFCNVASLADAPGRVYLMAKDQNGCRYLQKIFDEGTALDKQIIFNDVINHIVELMMDPFGNYLVQKLLDVCTEEQRMRIVLMVTEEPGQLVRISLNTYGTRVVQKLVDTLKTRSRRQIALVKAALKPGFLNLIKDLNGNHVIQRCLQCLSTEDNKFIFEAATRYCVDIATHRHGCCVLQRCISHSIGQQREKLITEISKNGLLLAQDPFGNYVVQYIIELKIPSAKTNLLQQFKGNYVQLSMQKFSSHVVERCLIHGVESRPQIIGEFLSVPHFDQLLQDPFANYVIQVALAVTKGALHASLVEAVRPHSMLRTSPYCKRIFSRNLLKKY